MAKVNNWALGAAILGLGFSAPGVALAKQEAMLSNLRYVNQVSALTCDDIDEAGQSDICVGAEMRLRLCEKGFDSEPALSSRIYQCYLRSQ